jgi:hypothetical protein
MVLRDQVNRPPSVTLAGLAEIDAHLNEVDLCHAAVGA